MTSETTPAQSCAAGPVPAPKLTARERNQAVQQQAKLAAPPLACSGTVFVGMFFDGTGNNEELDYNNGKVPPEKQKPSNVVRLYYAYKDTEKQGAQQSTDNYYKFYIPGVGTPFHQIQDKGAWAGGSFGAVGEQRILWGLLQVFNAVCRYVRGFRLLDDDAAGRMALLLESKLPAERHTLYNALQAQLKAKIAGDFKPAIDHIVVDVFGFSRGATQTRAWANWLYGLCEQQGSDPRTARYLFAGIPLQVRFMGIFDTVASVGVGGTVAGGVLESDGHHGWADHNLQIHPAIAHCEHYVAAHEVRASFPCDSVRVEAGYAPNVRESIYPGAHSDVGGGYGPKEQGKHHGLARIPGMAMFNAALSWGVPFWSLAVLKEKWPRYYANLIPDAEAVAAYQVYLQATGAAGGPLEQQHRAHWAWYLRYRFQSGARYDERGFVRAASAAERKLLIKSQRDLSQALSRAAAAARAVAGVHAPRIGATTPMHTAADALVLRMDKAAHLINPPAADQAPVEFGRLRQRLQQDGGVLLRDEHPDLDVAELLACVSATEAGATVPAAVAAFFDSYVHDSVAGFIEKLDEYDWNGYGLFKFRRIFFGNRGDAYAVNQAKAENAQRLAPRQRKQQSKA